MTISHFFAQDPSLPSIKLPVIEGRNQLWGKTREAFRHIWNNYKDQADWFFKADDDTYENSTYLFTPLKYSLCSWNLTGHSTTPTGMQFWKICDISCRLTTRQSLYGLVINSRPSSGKVILAVVQVIFELKISNDFEWALNFKPIFRKFYFK